MMSHDITGSSYTTGLSSTASGGCPDCSTRMWLVGGEQISLIPIPCVPEEAGP